LGVGVFAIKAAGISSRDCLLARCWCEQVNLTSRSVALLVIIGCIGLATGGVVRVLRGQNGRGSVWALFDGPGVWVVTAFILLALLAFVLAPQRGRWLVRSLDARLGGHVLLVRQIDIDGVRVALPHYQALGFRGEITLWANPDRPHLTIPLADVNEVAAEERPSRISISARDSSLSFEIVSSHTLVPLGVVNRRRIELASSLKKMAG
jgi:hypothetical protein